MEKGTNIHRDNEIEGRTDRRRETRGDNRDRQPYRETRARIETDRYTETRAKIETERRSYTRAKIEKDRHRETRT